MEKISAPRVREIAVRAFCDPRTVVRYFAGETVKALCAMRIEAALKELRIRR